MTGGVAGPVGSTMWLPGHLAVSFLICLPLIVYLKRERALALAYVGLFALLPDFLHLGMIRAFAHSFLGLAILLALALGILVILFRPRPALLLTAVVAASSHLLADLYVGSIWPFYPFSLEWIEFHGFDTPFDIRVEVVLATIALIILVVGFRPWGLFRSVEHYDRREKNNLIALLLILAAMLTLQGTYFFYSSRLTGLDIYREVLLLYFALPLLATLGTLFVLLVRHRTYTTF